MRRWLLHSMELEMSWRHEPFKEIGPRLFKFGYQPVPIKPGLKFPMIAGWQEPKSPLRYIRKYGQWGTGVLCSTTPAIDLDVRDKKLVQALIDLAWERLGNAPLRFGGFPKALMPYRTSTPFRKMSGVKFALPGENPTEPDYKPQQIEVLGDGNQFVAYARYNSRRFYKWWYSDLMSMPHEALSPITAQDARLFLIAAHRLLAAADCEPLGGHAGAFKRRPWEPEEIGAPRRRDGHDRRFRERVALARADMSWRQRSPEEVAKAVDARHAKKAGRNDGWVTKCPVHGGEGGRSLNLWRTPEGETAATCKAGCPWSQVQLAIAGLMA